MAQAAPIGATGERTAAHSRGADFVSLTKPRLNSLVLLTSAAAYFLGHGHELPWLTFVHLERHIGSIAVDDIEIEPSAPPD